jgi:two-component system, NarL family, sensor histidine kinase UhpB
MVRKAEARTRSIKNPVIDRQGIDLIERQIQSSLWMNRELRAICDHSPLYICILDRRKQVLFTNRAFCTFCGLSAKDLLHGRACGVFGCFNATESPRGCGFGRSCRTCALRLAIQDTLQTGRSHKNVEFRAGLERDGRRRQSVLLGTTVRITLGSESRIFLFLQDITKFKQLEESLRDSEARYRGMLEDQTEVISRFLPDGTFTFVNEAYCRFFGKTSRQLVGKKWQPRAVISDLTEIERKLHELSPSYPVVVIENRVHAGKGKKHWMQFINRGFYDREGQLLEIQSVGRDITDLKVAEQGLRQREARFHALFTHSVAGILLAKPDGRILAANPAACRMLGRTEAEIRRIGRAGLALKDDPQVGALLRQRNQEGYASGEVSFVRADGTCLPVQISSALFDCEVGIQACIIFQDISARKSAEEHIHAFSRKLLSVREEEKRTLSAVLHHEVGSGAVSVIAYLNAAESRLRSGKSDEALAALEECRRVFEETANNLKSLAVDLRPPALDILGLHTALRQHFVRIMHETPLKVAFFDAMDGRVISPEIQTFLFRTVQECLNNVIKHAEARRVYVRLSASGQWIRLSVKDNGKGYDPRRPAVDPHRHLGLRSIQEWVGGLGGKMDIATKPGGGTRVSIMVRGGLGMA